MLLFLSKSVHNQFFRIDMKVGVFLKFILYVLVYHIFFHITYFLTYDVLKYHKNHQIKIPESLWKQILVTFLSSLFICLFLPILENEIKLPFVLALAATLFMGLIMTKDAWFIYLNYMKKYKDSYFFKYNQFTLEYQKQFAASSPTVSFYDLPRKKGLEIINFIKPYKLLVKKSNGINSCSLLKENTIVITEGCFTLPLGEIKALLAHELMHFKIDGKISIKRRKLFFFIKLYLIFILFFVGAFLLKDAIDIFQLLFILLVCIYALYLLFFHLVIPERYLYQFSELKCDRLACTLKGVKQKDMLSLLKRFKTKKNKAKEKWYLKIIRRYFLFGDHPNIDYRIKKIEKYHRWSILDYFALPIHLLKQLMKGKGWNDN